VRRVRAWAGLRAFGLGREAAEDVAQATCAEVWRTFNLARGGDAFEGFVQGRFVEAVRMAPPAPSAPPPPGASPRLAAALAELRARNPRHHQALTLVYGAQATPEEAADELAVDAWEIRSMLARARQALARGLERPGRGAERAASKQERGGQEQRPGDNRRPAARAQGKPRRPGRR
jgi:DNA-directed RNA polymerase specialized sigma24 family protein